MVAHFVLIVSTGLRTLKSQIEGRGKIPENPGSGGGRGWNVRDDGKFLYSPMVMDEYCANRFSSKQYGKLDFYHFLILDRITGSKIMNRGSGIRVFSRLI